MLPMILAWVLLARARRMMFPLNVQIIPQTDAVALIAAILCVAGLSFCLWARVTLGRNWSGIVTLKKDHELIIRGPYALVRHPIYTGLVAMFAATALIYGYVGGILGTAIVFFSFWIKLRDEEELMLEKFPEAYAAYQCRVKCIIPFVL